jgi:hypothetical protein
VVVGELADALLTRYARLSPTCAAWRDLAGQQADQRGAHARQLRALRAVV